MNSTLRIAVVGLVSVLSGCAAIQRNGEPDGFQRSLTELRQKHKPDEPLIGTIPFDYPISAMTSTYAAAGVPVPDFDAIEQRKSMGFKSGTEQEMCFVLFELLEWNDYGNLRESEEPKFIASRRKRIEAGEFYLEAFDSLVDVPNRPVLPASGAQRLTVRSAEMGLDVRYFQKRTYDSQGNARSRKTRVDQKEMMYELCGPAPAVTPATRYFTVAQKFREATLNESYTHFLYVFARQDDGFPSLDLRGGDGSAPVRTTTGATPSTQPTGSEPPKTAAPPEFAKTAGKPRSSQLMSIESSTFAVGTAFKLTFNKPMKANPGEKFWVTIVFATAGDTAYTSYKYLEPDATSIELAAPAVTGDYEVRLHGNYPTKTYNLIDRLKFRSSQDPAKDVDTSEPVAAAPEPADKGAKSKMMSVTKARVDAKASFTVTFPRPLKAKKGEKYWLAIATPSTADTEYLSYQYIEVAGAKSLQLSAPDTAGEYELRLHGNYPTRKINVVDRLKFSVK